MVGENHLEILKGEFLRAAVVDDDAVARAALRRMLGDLACAHDFAIECFEYPSGAALIANPPSDIDILFIDVEMPLVNGVDAAAELRKTNESLVIVFITAYEEYALQSYSVQAKRYLIKPLSKVRFEREIVPLVQEIVSSRSDLMHIKTSEGAYAMTVRSIVYATTTPKKTIRFQTLSNIAETRGSLTDWERRLVPKGFARCHSGYLVNLAYVRCVGHTEVLLATGERIPLSKHRRKEFLDAFTLYVGQTV